MSANWAKHMLAGLTLGLVILLVVLDLDYASPGPLNATHARITELAGRAGCAACHGASEDALKLACLECHAPIDAQLASNDGFHGLLSDASDCGRCHAEHSTEALPLITAESFAFAGVLDRDTYDHAGLEFGLDGTHDALACDACHVNADISLIPVGEVRYLGLDQACATCHENPHDVSIGSNCAECHSQDGPFDVVGIYEHTPSFPLTGAHEGIGCYDCHENESPFSVERSRAEPPTETRACADCHEHSHSARFLTRVERIDGDANCTLCHDVVANGFAAEQTAMSPEHHVASGFPLDAPHDQLDCAACHAPELERALRFPGREANDCGVCHDDPHAGQFEVPVQLARECLECHAAQSFSPHEFSTERHAGTAFPLDGAHLDLTCSECHDVEALTGVREFRGTASACAACHEDVHAGIFETEAERIGATDCARCHVTSGFLPPIEDAFEHGRSTGFELLGKHAAAECVACHNTDSLGTRRLGSVSDVFPGNPERCDTCHEDVHDGRFLSNPESGAASDCATCHDENAFDIANQSEFAHGLWTGFDLRGAHERAQCSSCHSTADRAGDSRRSFGRVADTFPGPTERCDTCHADVHEGLLNRDPVLNERTDCRSCHNEEAFSPASHDAFDHANWTGFELEGAHAEASCNACHPTCRPDSSGRTFGRALGTGCADCHLDPHVGQFAADGNDNCARCHSSSASFTSLLFDHDRDSRFPLDATHAQLDCAACHKSWITADRVRAVRYKPLGFACADCHLPEAGDGDR